LHKNVPGKEGRALEAYHCKPWNKHSCCTWNTTSSINQDGTLSLYGITWDQCPQLKKMSPKCKEHFERDTCFYECSPNLGPWIVEDEKSKISRKERMVNVPLCAQDCKDWYHDCMFDYTCNDNWGKNWNWAKKGTSEMCTKPCKLIKDYFPNPKLFCENIFNFSFKYETNTSICMNMVPKGNKNYNVSMDKAKQLVREWETSGCVTIVSNMMAVFLAVTVCLKFNYF